ncbi:MAG: hypothetical protein ACLPX9_08705 [Rhodomicrobium sp.]
MDGPDKPFAPAPAGEHEPGAAISPPAAGFGLERLLLVFAVISAGLVFLPQTAETALLHWNIIGGEHEFTALLRKLGLWSCLACMAASWLLEKQKEEGGHQAIIFGMLAALLLFAAWAIERLVPFEGWWQALRLAPAVVYGGLAYAFLADGSAEIAGRPRTMGRRNGGRVAQRPRRR